MAKKSRRRKKKPLTPQQLEARKFKLLQRQFGKQVTTLFTRCGFKEVKSEGIQLDYAGQKGEIDRIFVLGRIIVFVEETCSESSANIKPHITKKLVFHAETKSSEAGFIAYLDEKIPGFKDARDKSAEPNDCKVSFVYAPRFNFEDSDQSQFKAVKFLHFQFLRYFLHLTKVIGKTARFELLKFLGFTKEDTVSNPGKSKKEYDGFVLPESPSGMPEGYRIVTFYIDPETLLGLSYALRRDSWQDSSPVYQRMLIPAKIRKMRAFLANHGHVYINNIVVSLPQETELRKDNKVLDKHHIKKATSVTVCLPDEFNTIGLIDGQHRVFSYHEGTDSNESKIAPRRVKQQLLVSGLIFPDGTSVDDRGKREADLFLEINETQSKAKAELKQAIATMIDPYSNIAIAKQIVSELAKSGPLAGLLQDHAFGEGTIKTSSIVSYALRYIVLLDDPSPADSFAASWDAEKIAKLRKRKDKDALREYIKFCAAHLSQFIGAFKATVVPNEMWTPDKKESRALSVTMLNGLIFCFRKILANGQLGDFKSYQKGFQAGTAKLNLNFKPKSFGYKSSHWKSLGEKVYADCFATSK